MDSTGTLLDYLRRVPLLQALDDQNLLDLLGRTEEVLAEPGTVLFHEGDEGDDLYVVLEGELLISRRVREIDDVIAVRGQGDVVGEMAVVTRRPRSASVTAGKPTRLLRLGRTAFEDLLSRSPSAATAIVSCMAGRIEDEQSNRSREERLVALGTMAAGLAHELNNPASALARSTSALGEAHGARDRSMADLFARDLSPEEKATVLELSAEAARHVQSAANAGGDGRVLPLPDPADEDTLTDHLSDMGVEQPWEAAPALLQAGWTLDDLEAVLGTFDVTNRPAVARWLAADAVARVLMAEIAMATGSIVAQVRAVKVSSHMDRASFDEVDVREGLESALVMVKRKLGDVKVVRDYDPDTPRIEAFPGELNQVWTNLIDNALDAMGGSGVLTLRTLGGDGQVTIEVSDTGPGVPADVLPKLFQPYFTTKGVGEGTGLGLPLAHKTVEQRHGGSIRVLSEPGSTTFRVTLPVARRKAPSAATQTADE
ncbi:MAG TPA: ATP-binding protein [Trueperaceae bacterium]|nr:ATP-binding protein [Trueperaceae bacterium]